MNDLTLKQKKVLKTARARLEKEPWFRGICLDHFPTDEEIDKDFNHAVQSVVIETEMWDAWDKDGFIPFRESVQKDGNNQ